jgi:hypothetical protein
VQSDLKEVSGFLCCIAPVFFRSIGVEEKINNSLRDSYVGLIDLTIEVRGITTIGLQVGAFFIADESTYDRRAREGTILINAVVR